MTDSLITYDFNAAFQPSAPVPPFDGSVNYTPSSTPIGPMSPFAGAAGVAVVTATGDRNIDGLLYGTKWTGTVTYSFPDSRSDYPTPYGDGEPSASGFKPLSLGEQQAYKAVMAQVAGLTTLQITYAGRDTADIQIAHSDAGDPTAYAYFPWDSAEGGDIWIGNQWDYTQPRLGDYNYFTVLHEVGHSFGLKNAHEASGYIGTTVPRAHDAVEFTVESYRSYVGGSTTGGYSNEWHGFPTTFMMNDILALQTLYGANYSTRSSNTTYSWDPKTGQQFINGIGQGLPGSGAPASNRVFMTVWDGGGNDTFDLSSYSTGMAISLEPGKSSSLSIVQRAYLGNGHYASGNVYNAYLFNDDPRSLIENVIGGRGDDVIVGNQAANRIDGRFGSDVINGLAGNDTINGSNGKDDIQGSAGDDVIDGGPGADHLMGGDGTDTLSFASALAGVTATLPLGVAQGGGAGDDFSGFENLTGSKFKDVLRGSGFDNAIDGGDGSDLLEGGAGADSLIGGRGIDTTVYSSDGSGIVISMRDAASNTGHAAGDSYTSIENVKGGNGNDTITGTGSDNLLSGAGGNDWLYGGAGGDTLDGGTGADRLFGGRGYDTLTGSFGSDRFVFTGLSDSAAFTYSDVITDFNMHVDKIDVSAIDAVSGGTDDTFSFIGTGEFTAVGQLRVWQDGQDTVVEVNTSGSLVLPEMSIRLGGIAAVALSAEDFIL